MKRSPIVPILEELAQEMGIQFKVEPRYGYVGRVVLPDGQSRYLRGTVFDINGAGATEIAKDKDYASYFLASLGYPVPEGESFHTWRWARAIESDRTPDKAWEYAQKLGLPVIVKPNSKSQGAGVALVRDEAQFFRAVAIASQNESVFLVQRPAKGMDYRIVVLDGEIISAYERQPLMVTGDGHSTVRDLLKEKQASFVETGRDTILKPDDPRIADMLKTNGLTRDSVLGSSETVALLPNANLSSGGDANDVTNELHPEWKALAQNISRDMNLRYIGIDVMSEETLSKAPTSYVIIEVNAAPGLDHYASIGEHQAHVVKVLYKKVLEALLRS